MLHGWINCKCRDFVGAAAQLWAVNRSVDIVAGLQIGSHLLVNTAAAVICSVMIMMMQWTCRHASLM